MLQSSPHTPMRQIAAPLAVDGQRTPQCPQLETSLSVSTQFEPHTSGDGGEQVLTHTNVPAPPLAHRFGGAHGVEHEPQVLAVERSDSQPSSIRVVQCARPDTHAPLTSQTPPTHATRA